MIMRTDYSMRALLLMLAVSVACRSRAVADNARAVGIESASASIASTTTAVPRVAVRLERGPCFGRCPEYAVELMDDGAVRFDGRKNVGAMGEQRATIAATDVSALVKQFADAGFASADSAYVEGSPHCGQYFTDGPSAVLSVLVGVTLKTVRLDAGCMGTPQYLKTLSAQVDSIARTSAWTTVVTKEKKP